MLSIQLIDARELGVANLLALCKLGRVERSRAAYRSKVARTT